MATAHIPVVLHKFLNPLSEKSVRGKVTDRGAPAVLQKIVNQLPEKSVKGKVPVLSLSNRMTLIEQALIKLEQDSEWWTIWKMNRKPKMEESHANGIQSDDEENVIGAVGNSLENSL